MVAINWIQKLTLFKGIILRKSSLDEEVPQTLHSNDEFKEFFHISKIDPIFGRKCQVGNLFKVTSGFLVTRPFQDWRPFFFRVNRLFKLWPDLLKSDAGFYTFITFLFVTKESLSITCLWGLRPGLFSEWPDFLNCDPTFLRVTPVLFQNDPTFLRVT